MSNLSKVTAKKLRKNQTPEETLLWKILRNRNLSGMKFLRQHPIKFQHNDKERFIIADFYCAEKGLILEIDGSIHDNEKERDEYRTDMLKKMNLNVLRIKNDELQHIQKVTDKIKSALSLLPEQN
jgi:very-short-patch-repair endonuclease